MVTFVDKWGKLELNCYFKNGENVKVWVGEH